MDFQIKGLRVCNFPRFNSELFIFSKYLRQTKNTKEEI
jgi:hypothetical protein